jgi:uncharacterized protein (TIGR02680 family)
MQQLHVVGDAGVLDALVEWVSSLIGDNPARSALHLAQQVASERLAQQYAALSAELKVLELEQAALQTERSQLEQGVDATPPPPHYRAADARIDRSGAPLWQLVEFHADADARQRAGLEAALQSAGLLDAWVSPDGQLQLIDERGEPVHDTLWMERPRQARSLADWLLPSETHGRDGASVPAATLLRLLEGVACGAEDDAVAEAWFSLDGRFRLGAFAGAWSKNSADFIGFAARAAARLRRMEEIALRLNSIEAALLALRQRFEQHAQDQRQAASEWQGAPSDDALRAVHVEAASRAREFQAARERLDQADQKLLKAQQLLLAARDALASDALDLRLPNSRPALQAIEQALQQFSEALHALFQGAREMRDSLSELAHQQQRTQEAQHAAEQAAAQWSERCALAQEASIRLETLRESVGAQVEELQQRLQSARTQVNLGDAQCKRCNEALRLAGEERARAEQKAQDAQATLEERVAARQSAVAQLQGFAATGLLACALPEAELPDPRSPWTIDAALTLARRAEQVLASVRDDDDAWTRVQSQI